MKRENRKRTISWIAVLMLMITLTGCAAKGIPAKQWVEDAYASIGEYQEFCESLDNIMSLYLVGSMDISDFKAELSMLRVSLMAMNEKLAKEEIKPGTQTEQTKEAYETFIILQKEMDTLSQDLCAGAEDMDALIDIYFTGEETIVGELERFLVLYSQITE